MSSNIEQTEAILKQIYSSPPIYRKGKKLFSNLALIYETSKKALEKIDNTPVKNQFENIDYKKGSLSFLLKNDKTFISLLSFIISNPQVSISYSTLSDENYSITIEFKSHKKFVKFLEYCKKPTLETPSNGG
ncbi:MAG: hypothetical protein [Caudoviricetes sp.]|nr:MAG: hypothetical protein [Caudoviricetes sp.]